MAKKYFSDWFKDLKMYADAMGYNHVITAYPLHVDSYVAGRTALGEFLGLAISKGSLPVRVDKIKIPML